MFAAPNPKDHDVDFYIQGVPFDHKSTVYPAGFERALGYTQTHPRELIEWLYCNQSQGNRKHLYNRLFVVLYDIDGGQHWKLKADIDVIEAAISAYLENFEPSQLHSFRFHSAADTVSDIIWVVHGAGS